MPDIDSAHFRQVLGHFPTGVTVITATGSEGRPAGFAVGSFFSVSLELLCVVGFDGSVRVAKSCGNATLDRLAQEYMKRFRFAAAEVNGRKAGKPEIAHREVGMLAGHDQGRRNAASGKSACDGRHFDGFRPGADDQPDIRKTQYSP